jgi:hypothetical protein
MCSLDQKLFQLLVQSGYLNGKFTSPKKRITSPIIYNLLGQFKLNKRKNTHTSHTIHIRSFHTQDGSYDLRHIKGTGSILFLKNGLKKFCRKNYKIISEEIIMRYKQL